MMAQILHGWLQKARLDAEGLGKRYRSKPDGALWRYSPQIGWVKVGQFTSWDDVEDFLVSKLCQMER